MNTIERVVSLAFNAYRLPRKR